jgi:hypothetical protein
VAAREEEGLLIHPAMRFPFAKKVTFPSEPATPKLAVKSREDLKGIDDALVSETDEFVCNTPPLPSKVK